MEGGRETDPLHLFWLSGNSLKRTRNSLKRTRNSRSKVFLQVTFRQTRGITAIPRHFLKQLLCTAVVAHAMVHGAKLELGVGYLAITGDRKSTRLNSSHVAISYAVFCLKK